MWAAPSQPGLPVSQILMRRTKPEVMLSRQLPPGVKALNMFSKIEVDASDIGALHAAFLTRLSIEITPKQIEKVALLKGKLPQGTCVYVALIDPADLALQIEAVSAIRAAGLEPVPHVPARFVRDRADLEHRLHAFAKGGKVA